MWITECIVLIHAQRPERLFHIHIGSRCELEITKIFFAIFCLPVLSVFSYGHCNTIIINKKLFARNVFIGASRIQ